VPRSAGRPAGQTGYLVSTGGLDQHDPAVAAGQIEAVVVERLPRGGDLVRALVERYAVGRLEGGEAGDGIDPGALGQHGRAVEVGTDLPVLGDVEVAADNDRPESRCRVGSA